MPTSRYRKSSRKRTREIREQSRTTGTQYTEALRANDRTRADGWQPDPSAPLAELRLGTVRTVAGFARLLAEEAARKMRGSAVQNALREVLHELVENDLAVRIFETNTEIATAAENLLVDALDPAASVYGEPDDEEPASAADVQGYWRTLLDLAYLDRDHPDLPHKVRATFARWTQLGLDCHRRDLRHDRTDRGRRETRNSQ